VCVLYFVSLYTRVGCGGVWGRGQNRWLFGVAQPFTNQGVYASNYIFVLVHHHHHHRHPHSPHHYRHRRRYHHTITGIVITTINTLTSRLFLESSFINILPLILILILFPLDLAITRNAFFSPCRLHCIHSFIAILAAKLQITLRYSALKSIPGFHVNEIYPFLAGNGRFPYSLLRKH